MYLIIIRIWEQVPPKRRQHRSRPHSVITHEQNHNQLEYSVIKNVSMAAMQNSEVGRTRYLLQSLNFVFLEIKKYLLFPFGFIASWVYHLQFYSNLFFQSPCKPRSSAIDFICVFQLRTGLAFPISCNDQRHPLFCNLPVLIPSVWPYLLSALFSRFITPEDIASIS
jgi:hypothetical protein